MPAVTPRPNLDAVSNVWQYLLEFRCQNRCEITINIWLYVKYITFTKTSNVDVAENALNIATCVKSRVCRSRSSVGRALDSVWWVPVTRPGYKGPGSEARWSLHAYETPDGYGCGWW